MKQKIFDDRQEAEATAFASGIARNGGKFRIAISHDGSFHSPNIRIIVRHGDAVRTPHGIEDIHAAFEEAVNRAIAAWSFSRRS